MKKEAFAIVFLALAAAGCKAATKFEETFSRPAWFNSVKAPKLSTADEVSALWQSEKRCCENPTTLLKNNRIFYKSCFNAITAHYEDEELVVKCLWLMDIGADEGQRMELTRFLVDNFAQHKDRIDYCANCMTGDTIARATLDLVTFESRSSHSKEPPIGRIEHLLDTRGDEISYWVQAEIYEFLGQVYLETGLTPERLDRYGKAYAKLNKVKEFNEPLARRFPPLEKIYKVMLGTTEPVKLEKE